MCNDLVELCLHSNKWNMWDACVEAQRASSTIGQTFAPKPPEPLLFLQSITVKHQTYTPFELPGSSDCNRSPQLSVGGGS